MNVTVKFAGLAVRDFQDAERLGKISNEALLRRILATLLVQCAGTSEPAVERTANYLLSGQCKAFYSASDLDRGVPVTDTMIATRFEAPWGWSFSLSQDDIVRLFDGDEVSCASDDEPFAEWEECLDDAEVSK